jgi:acetoacetyl-CoA reductase/3-oxoacyl-[acyl-carrier protein] reductase
VIEVSREVVEEMRTRRSGRVVNMSTESAFYGDIGFVDYAAAKMGGVVAFLASDDARYVTGQSILIDGGRWMI